MKKIFIFFFAFIFFLSVICLNHVLAQNAQKEKVTGKPIPAKLSKIFKKSCPDCHNEPGKEKALKIINFSKWDSDSPEKQAETALVISNYVVKEKAKLKEQGKVPPANAPSSHDIKKICKWARSLQTAKK